MNVFRMLFVIVIIVLLSLVLVWEQNHIIKIGYGTAKLQKQKIDLIEENRKLELEVGKLISGNRISEVIKSFRLNLVHASENIYEYDDSERLYTQADFRSEHLIKEF